MIQLSGAHTHASGCSARLLLGRLERADIESRVGLDCSHLACGCQSLTSPSARQQAAAAE